VASREEKWRRVAAVVGRRFWWNAPFVCLEKGRRTRSSPAALVEALKDLRMWTAASKLQFILVRK
jgi:hypothetical protein